MIREITSTHLNTLEDLNYTMLVFENYGLNIDKNSVVLITPFTSESEAYDFFDNSKRAYNFVKIAEFSVLELINKYHLVLYIDIPEPVKEKLS